MALRIAWAGTEEKEAAWPWDPAYNVIPDDVLKAFGKDPDSALLAPFLKPGQAPTVITYRNLSASESAYCEDAKKEDGNLGEESFLRAFKIACRFPGIDKITDETGVVHDGTVRLVGRHLQLQDGFVTALVKFYPHIASFFGAHVVSISRLTDAEKKALSPPSIPTPSSAAPQTPTVNDSSKADTAASAVQGEPVA